MKNLLVIGVSLAVSTTFAYTVSGKVTDESSMPIKGAQVTLVKENKATTTDNKGEFTIHPHIEPRTACAMLDTVGFGAMLKDCEKF